MISVGYRLPQWILKVHKNIQGIQNMGSSQNKGNCDLLGAQSPANLTQPSLRREPKIQELILNFHEPELKGLPSAKTELTDFFSSLKP